MRIKDKIFSFILVFIIIALIAVVGLFGYAIYLEITEQGTIEIGFSEEKGYPVIEYKPNVNNPNRITANPDSLELTISSGDGEKNKSYKHLYNQLNNDAKIIYNKLYESKEQLKTGTYVIKFGNTFHSTLLKENGDDELKNSYQSAIEALLYENPDIFYLEATHMYINIEKITKITGLKFNVYINCGTKMDYLAEGFYSKEDIEKCEEEIEVVKNQILSLVEGKTQYEAIKIVHNYLIDSIEYDSTILGNNIYNIYGALVSKKSVCEGYAKAFQYLMNEIGIDNTIVIGTATNSKNETENHAWNYVKLDGIWYAVDVTWDDPIILGRGKLTERLRYQYFLKGSMEKNHTPSGNFTKDGQIFEYPVLSEEDYN